ncbi:MAG: LPXTG cell wall anchor domain-containing protein [Chloroflexota bacterium]
MNRSLTLTIALLLVLAGSLVAAAPVAAADPGLTVQGPKNGATMVASSVTINFTVTDFKIVPSTVPLSEAGKHPELNHPGEGHLHLKLDLQPLIVWDKNAPYTLTNIAPGNHQLMIELANNDHASLSPKVMEQINFTTQMALPATGSNNEEALALFIAAALVMLTSGLLYRRRGKQA